LLNLIYKILLNSIGISNREKINACYDEMHAAFYNLIIKSSF